MNSFVLLFFKPMSYFVVLCFIFNVGFLLSIKHKESKLFLGGGVNINELPNVRSFCWM